MPKYRITLPISLLALAAWLAITTIAGRVEAGGAYQSLEEAVAGHIGIGWVLAALFAVLVALASEDRARIGLCTPRPLSSVRLVWLPLLCALLVLAIPLVDGLPAGRAVMTLAVNAALVGLSEELMFRGILLQGFLSRLSPWPAVLASSAVFGISHAANGFATGDMANALWQSAAAFLQGFGYAAIRLRTGSVWPMVFVHGLWDFALMASILSAAQDGAALRPGLSLIAVLPMFLYGLYLLRLGQDSFSHTVFSEGVRK